MYGFMIVYSSRYLHLHKSCVCVKVSSRWFKWLWCSDPMPLHVDVVLLLFYYQTLKMYNEILLLSAATISFIGRNKSLHLFLHLGEILMDTDFSNIWCKIFCRMITVFHHAPVNTVMLLKISRLNFDSLAGKCPKCQNFSLSKFCAIRYVQWMVATGIVSPMLWKYGILLGIGECQSNFYLGD